MKEISLMLTAGAGAAIILGLLRARRRHNENQTLKMEIKKWEDEGGNVPEVPAVTPGIKPEKSVPPGH